MTAITFTINVPSTLLEYVLSSAAFFPVCVGLLYADNQAQLTKRGWSYVAGRPFAEMWRRSDAVSALFVGLLFACFNVGGVLLALALTGFGRHGFSLRLDRCPFPPSDHNKPSQSFNADASKS